MTWELNRRSAIKVVGVTAAAVAAGAAIASCTREEGKTPDMTTSPDHYQALADAEFTGGYPSDDAAKTLTDELYFQRAVQSYLWALPAVNIDRKSVV